jgi:hypothetical protein
MRVQDSGVDVSVMPLATGSGDSAREGSNDEIE